MSFLVRKQAEEVIYALPAAIKAARVLGVGANFHVDTTCTSTTGTWKNPTAVVASVSLASPVDLPTLLVFAAQLDAIYRLSIGDESAHKVPDVANVPANALPIDLATSITYLNDVKAKFNTHIASTTYHYTADATNTIAAANATVLADSLTLAIATKVSLNAHILGAAAGHGIRMIGP